MEEFEPRFRKIMDPDTMVFADQVTVTLGPAVLDDDETDVRAGLVAMARSIYYDFPWVMPITELYIKLTDNENAPPYSFELEGPWEIHDKDEARKAVVTCIEHYKANRKRSHQATS